jgi:hypothetical protein
MFVTLPQFEEPTMTAMAGGGQHYWRALVAEFPVLPWYLFVRKGVVADATVDLVMLVAWEENLIDIITATPGPARGAVYRVDPSPSGELKFRGVRALWRASERGRSDGHMALLALEGAAKPMDSSLHPVEPEYVGELVYTAPGGR